MHQRKLGPFDVSAIGLGCMNMSMGYGKADDTTSARLLNLALDAGYTFFDTANMYGNGHNETLIGRALRHRRGEFILASKCGIGYDSAGKTCVDGRPAELKKNCEDSLRRLQTEVIDLYYLHRPDPKVALEDSIGALSELVQAGKIRTIGVSEVSTANLHRAHKTHPITALQSEYSLWSRTPERKIRAACEQLGIAFVPFSPLGRAFLTGKACDTDQLPADDIRATIARPRFEPENFARNSRLLAPFAEIAAQQGCSMAQLALAWLLAQSGGRMIPIPGTKHIDYMRENAGADTVALSPEVVLQLDRLFDRQAIFGSRYTAAGMATSDAEKD